MELLICELECYVKAFPYFNQAHDENKKEFKYDSDSNKEYISINLIKKKLEKSYEDLINHPLFPKIRHLIYFDHISIVDLWTEYIYNGVLNLLSCVLKFDLDIIEDKFINGQSFIVCFLQTINQLQTKTSLKYHTQLDKLSKVINEIAESIDHKLHSPFIVSIGNTLETKVLMLEQENKFLDLSIDKEKPFIERNLGSLLDYLLQSTKKLNQNNIYDLCRIIFNLKEEVKTIVIEQFLSSALQNTNSASVIFILKIFTCLLEYQVIDSNNNHIPMNEWNNLSPSYLTQAKITAKEFEKMGLSIVLSKLLVSQKKKTIFSQAYFLLLALYYDASKSNFCQLLFLQNKDLKNQLFSKDNKCETELLVSKIIFETLKNDFEEDSVISNFLEYLIKSSSTFDNKTNFSKLEEEKEEEVKHKENEEIIKFEPIITNNSFELLINVDKILEGIINGKTIETLMEEFGPVRVELSNVSSIFNHSINENQTITEIKDSLKKAMNNLIIDNILLKLHDHIKINAKVFKGEWKRRAQEIIAGYILASSLDSYNLNK